jgi:dolichyl-phosphate beta-glucosyltransferase
MIDSISLIFPVFNEQLRIDNSLNKIKKFIDSTKLQYVEIIFIDDGSTDKTYLIIKNFFFKILKKNVKLILLKNNKNYGKGYSLKKGVAYSNAKWVLTLDIDLSVNINQFQKWSLNNLSLPKQNYYIYLGSRNLPNSKVNSSYLRYSLGYVFKFLVFVLFQLKYHDTQCGYKLYKKEIAKKLFSKLRDNRFAHDIEIILIANLMKISIKEMPVKWVHKKGSKLNIFKDIFIMFWDLLIIKKRFLNRGYFFLKII